MKKILLLTVSLLFITMVNAQVKRSKDYLNAGTDTTWNNISEPLKRTKVSNGDVKIHLVPGKYTLYAIYKSRKVTGYYAIDAKGNKIPANKVTRPDTYSAKALKCYTCVRVCDDSGKCAEDCTQIACPDSITGEKATTATAQ